MFQKNSLSRKHLFNEFEVLEVIFNLKYFFLIIGKIRLNGGH